MAKKIVDDILIWAPTLEELGNRLMFGGRFRLVMCGSKPLTPTQQRYSTIELECLGVHYAITKCAFSLKGLLNLVLLTDHKSLEGIFKKDLFELSNPRLQHIREKLGEYSFQLRQDPLHSRCSVHGSTP